MPKGRLLSPGRTSAQSVQKSRKQERQLAESLGGKRVVGSGNQWHSKGDVKTREDLIEAKVTRKGSYRLKVKDLKDHQVKAALAGKRALFVIEFEEDGNPWVVVPLYSLKGLRKWAQ